ncbi:MAG: ATP-binding cassette domain-containing protein, partial [Micromonosporaceae bacterium]|nr:ATP-binding cassette domain-containing protein [Micromonosporaceae bacterium]
AARGTRGVRADSCFTARCRHRCRSDPRSTGSVPTTGRVRYHGRDLATVDPLWLRRQVGMVFQRPTPFPGTVRDNLEAAVPNAGPDQLRQALELAALDESWLERDATALSGGEAQRVCLARTLVQSPQVLLLDEPTSALDEAATRLLERAVRRLADTQTAVVWVSHDPDQVRRTADRVLRIEHGRATGHDACQTPEVATDPATREGSPRSPEVTP